MADNFFDSLWRRIYGTFTGKVLVESVLNTEERIEKWLDVYRGKADWLTYSYAGVDGYKHERTRRNLNMGKVVCREIAGLVWSENPAIENGENSPLLPWLEMQNFFNRAQTFTEYCAAAGGFALKLRSPKDGALVVDFVTANYFIPVSWDNSGVFEADFISRRVEEKQTYLSVESHRKLSDTEQEITITEWKEDGQYLKDKREISRTPIKSRVPLFSYIPMPEVNNFDPDSPLGAAIFANAVDTIQSLDIAFDALGQEILLGKKRIIVPAAALKIVLDPKTGKNVRYFDPSDEAYQAFDMRDVQNLTITDNTVEMRIEEIRLAIQTLLDILATQIGFSSGTFSFDGVAVKTATEVISENSKTFKTKQNYENAIGAGMQRLFAAVAEIGGAYNLAIKPEVGIVWNDSIIEDRNSKTDYWLKRYQNGTCTLEEVLENLDGLSEEDAAAEAAKIKEQKSTVDVTKLFSSPESFLTTSADQAMNDALTNQRTDRG